MDENETKTELASVEASVIVEPKSKSRRGFASMSKERVTEIARKGGLAMPNEKRAYAVNRELARAAGKKGGEASRKKSVAETKL